MRVISSLFYLMMIASGIVYAQDADIRDIKPPVNFPFNYKLLFVILSVLILLILLFLIILYLKRRKLKKENPVFVPEKPAHIKALEALSRLYVRNLPGIGKIKEFYFELSDIVRHYLEERFFLRAPEMTTEEFLYMLRELKDLNQNLKDLLKQFLNHCDMVKFAKYGPDKKEIEESFNSARRLIEETKVKQEDEKEAVLK